MPKYRDHQRRFLKLPFEVRKRIYEHLLCTPATKYSPYRIRHKLNEGYDESSRYEEGIVPYIGYNDGWRKATNLDILRTCRAIHGEARPIFYANNTFVWILPPSERFVKLESSVPTFMKNPAWTGKPVFFSWLPSRGSLKICYRLWNRLS